MKKILLCSVLLLVSLSVSAKVSINEALDIYHRLGEKSHVTLGPLYIAKESQINGWVTDDYKLFITQGDLDKLSKPEMVQILGHEIAHIYFKDPDKNLGGTYQEDRADQYGAIWGEKIGYSQCQMALIFLRFYKEGGNQGGPGDPHSSNLKRFWTMYKGCKLK